MDAKPEQTGTGSRVRGVALTVLALVLLAVLWQQVFAMTGVLWWDAPTDKPYARPAAPRLPVLQTGWVNVDTYLKTHPEWTG